MAILILAAWLLLGHYVHSQCDVLGVTGIIAILKRLTQKVN